ncbi:PQQ-dependent sugar dehydrogenase, partial [Candidatus Pacearchaeota archaeon]|nr:PQQ-dependent sugar dehydrogenase [Candidatus Pacearchaeota archaeon]
MKNIDSSEKRRMFTIISLLIILIVFLFLLKYKLITNKEEVNLDGIFNHDIQSEDIEIFAQDLNTPWEIVFLQDNEALVTERSGNLIRTGIDKKSIRVKGVTAIEEGGLLGLALHPNFKNNHWIYLYLTSEVNGKMENRVERYKLDLENSTLKEKLTLISGIPGTAYHNGGRLKFGPDNYLYINTGDATESYLSQDINSTAGKILRVDENGKTPRDNPFKNKVYSYGYKNPQGLTWDDKNRIWVTDNGRSGVKVGLDELNLVKKKKN